MPRFVVSGLFVLLTATVGLGQHMIAVDSSRALYEIDVATGAKTSIGTVSANAGTTGGLAIGAANVVYLTSTGNDSLYTLDLATATATLVGAYGDSAIVMHGLEYVPATGKLYGVSSHNNGLYDINPATGVATLIGTSGLSSFTNLGWDSTNGIMYATNSSTPENLYTMNLATGAVTLVGALSGPTNPNGVAYVAATDTLYMVDNSTDNLYTINRTTGAATVIGTTGTGNLLGLAWTTGPVPVELQTFDAD